MSMTFVTRVGKRGTVVIPLAVREKFSLKEGDLMISEADDSGLSLKPAVVLPVETYSPERKAEFILSNSVSEEDYQNAKQVVKAMGLDPTKIKHHAPGQ